MSGKYQRLSLVSVVAMVGILGGCGSELLPNAAASEIPDIFVTFTPSGDGGDAALLAGTATNLDGCFVVKLETSDEYILPLIPENRITNRSGLHIQGRRVLLGGRIELGGGYSQRSALEQNWGKLNIPQTCQNAAAELKTFIVGNYGA